MNHIPTDDQIRKDADPWTEWVIDEQDGEGWREIGPCVEFHLERHLSERVVDLDSLRAEGPDYRCPTTVGAATKDGEVPPGTVVRLRVLHKGYWHDHYIGPVVSLAEARRAAGKD